MTARGLRPRLWITPRISSMPPQRAPNWSSSSSNRRKTVELDFSDDDEPLDSELVVEPLDELLAELLAASRLSLR